MDKEDLTRKLTATLRAINFDARYYGFYDHIRDHTAGSKLKKAEFESALKATNLAFKYSSRENFFYSETRQLGSCEAALKVRFQNDEAEYILYLKTPSGQGGGPFALLANQAGLSRESGFSPAPAYPTLPFTNGEQLGEVVHFGVELYSDIITALEASDICGSKA